MPWEQLTRICDVGRILTTIRIRNTYNQNSQSERCDMYRLIGVYRGFQSCETRISDGEKGGRTSDGEGTLFQVDFRNIKLYSSKMIYVSVNMHINTYLHQHTYFVIIERCYTQWSRCKIHSRLGLTILYLALWRDGTLVSNFRTWSIRYENCEMYI